MDREEWITSQEAFELGFSTAQTRNEAMQALEANYMFNLVSKLKEKDKELSVLKEKIEQNSIEQNNNLKPIKEDAWASFFNTKK